MRFDQGVIEGFLTPRDLAAAIGVSESSLKRWADEGFLRASRTAGGHRRIPISEAVRFIRDTHCAVVRPELLGFGDARLEAPIEAGSAGQALADAFLRDDQKAARGLLLGEFLSGGSIASILDGSLRVALEKVGQCWLDGPEGIMIEHRAVDTAVHSLSTMRSTIAKPVADAPCAVGGAPSGDPYLLPSLGCAIVLAENGFVDVNLGPGTPLEAMLPAIDRYRPSIVWRAVTDFVPIASLGRELETIAARLAPWNGVVVVGGRSRPAANEYPTGVRVLGSMSELVALARAVVAGSTAPSGDASPLPA
ncbi:MAG: helix-turn-helix domain-containing protein [Alphaproteobacteria bacterium]